MKKSTEKTKGVNPHGNLLFKKAKRKKRKEKKIETNGMAIRSSIFVMVHVCLGRILEFKYLFLKLEHYLY